MCPSYARGKNIKKRILRIFKKKDFVSFLNLKKKFNFNFNCLKKIKRKSLKIDKI